jgi:hypothetical protein
VRWAARIRASWASGLRRLLSARWLITGFDHRVPALGSPHWVPLGSRTASFVNSVLNGARILPDRHGGPTHRTPQKPRKTSGTARPWLPSRLDPAVRLGRATIGSSYDNARPDAAP